MMQSIQDIRKEKGFSQQQVADMLGINRVTYSLSETNKRPWKDEEIEELSQIFDVPMELLLGNNQKKIGSHNKNLDKKMFEKVLLYILNKVGIKPNIGKTVLYKLLYFADFDHYEKYGRSITGIDYIRLPRGPAPCNFDILTNELQKKHKILVTDQHYMGYYQKKYYPNELYNGEDLSVEAKTIIDYVIDTLSDANASEISDYSHGDAPWLQTKDMEIIDYGLTKVRLYPYSIIAREQRKDQAFADMKVSGIFNDVANESNAYEKYRNA